MTNKWIKGDLDDMIFADCDLAAQRAVRQIPEQSATPERGYFFCRSAVWALYFFTAPLPVHFPVR
mgnify:CR=1 FL=1